MARITDEMDAQQGGSTAGMEETTSLSEAQSHTISAYALEYGQAIDLPHNDFVKNSEILRDGQDLVLQLDDGSSFTVEGYYSVDTSPVLNAPDGSSLTEKLVNSFVQNQGYSEYAQNATMIDASPVGAVEEVSGNATLIRADGSTMDLTIGTPIFQGDVVQTQGDGAVKIAFIDESTFAVSENAKVAIDKFQFDDGSDSGATDFSVVKGVFMYTSGLIGRDDPDDVHIETPQGSIGIRGTTIAGDVDSGEVTVLEGAIVLRTPSGHEVTLANQFETARFGGADGGIEYQGIKDAAEFNEDFASIKQVSGDIFNSFDANNDNGNAEGDNSNVDAESSEAETEAETSEDANASDENTDNEAGTEADAEAAESQDSEETKEGASEESEKGESSEETKAGEESESNESRSEDSTEESRDAQSDSEEKSGESSSADSSETKTETKDTSSEESRDNTNTETESTSDGAEAQTAESATPTFDSAQNELNSSNNQYAVQTENRNEIRSDNQQRESYESRDYDSQETDQSFEQHDETTQYLEIEENDTASNVWKGGDGDDDFASQQDGQEIYTFLGKDRVAINHEDVYVKTGDDQDNIYVYNSGYEVHSGYGEDLIYLYGADASEGWIEGGNGNDTLILNDTKTWFIGSHSSSMNLKIEGIEAIYTDPYTYDNIVLAYDETFEGATLIAQANYDSTHIDNIIVDFTGYDFDLNATLGSTTMPGANLWLTNTAGEQLLRVRSFDNFTTVIDGANSYFFASDDANHIYRFDEYAENTHFELFAGNNHFEYSGENLSIHSGDGDDYIRVQGDVIDIRTEGGNDEISMEGGSDNEIRTGAGEDALTILNTTDTYINSGDDDDNIRIDASHDLNVETGHGNDQIDIYGTTSHNYFHAGTGNDLFYIFGGHHNHLSGQDGNDTFKLSTGNFTDDHLAKLSGDNGIDRAVILNADVEYSFAGHSGTNVSYKLHAVERIEVNNHNLEATFRIDGDITDSVQDGTFTVTDSYYNNSSTEIIGSFNAQFEYNFDTTAGDQHITITMDEVGVDLQAGGSTDVDRYEIYSQELSDMGSGQVISEHNHGDSQFSLTLHEHNDHLTIGGAGFHTDHIKSINMGAGMDTLHVGTGGTTNLGSLDFSNLDSLSGIETIVLTDQSLTLTLDQIMELIATAEGGELFITADGPVANTSLTLDVPGVVDFALESVTQAVAIGAGQNARAYLDANYDNGSVEVSQDGDDLVYTFSGLGDVRIDGNLLDAGSDLVIV